MNSRVFTPDSEAVKKIFEHTLDASCMVKNCAATLQFWHNAITCLECYNPVIIIYSIFSQSLSFMLYLLMNPVLTDESCACQLFTAWIGITNNS